ncbi:MAG: SDR family NAD(P)-dependent oxidoreductase, partial [Micromonosporaceae bacterium]|nr:SDR family NAD(P)-dependent oxidoreductase [Micromonosporaceae bacterium]
LAEWFAVPTWRQVAADRRSQPPGRVLVLTAGARGTALAAALRAAGAEVLERPMSDVDGRYDELVAAGVPDRVVHAYALDGQPAGRDLAAAWAAQDRGFFSVLSLVQALSAAGLVADRSTPVRLDLLCCGVADVRPGDAVRPEHATLAGLVRVLPAELPGLSIRLIDADPSDQSTGQLAAELCRPEPVRQPEVALRGGRRWVLEYQQCTVDTGEPGALRDGGRYLITGGLGGIGITLAEDFARRARARLVLVSRAGLPPREQWAGYLAANGTDRTARAIAAVGRIEQAGGEVLVVAADVTEPADLRRVREAAQAAFGGLDGIVHAAGLAGGGMAEVKQRDVAWAVLAPKLAGTLALAQVFGDLPMDFVALCSSITAVVGGFGQVDYCAANAFLDAYARSDHGWSAPLVSQDWGGWAELGMAVETAVPDQWRALSGRSASRPLVHPMLDTLTAGPDRIVLAGRIGAGTHWVLDEHRIGGIPVVPGTAHLECARAAVAAAVPPPAAGEVAVELRDVAFLEPFAVPDGTQAQYRVEVSPAADGTQFAVCSGEGGAVATHVRGSAGWTTEPAPPPLDLAAIIGRSRRIGTGAAPQHPAGGDGGPGRLVYRGPRWRALAELYLADGVRADGVEADGVAGNRVAGNRVEGDGVQLARIEAPEVASAELADWTLHPALLDIATGFGRSRGEGTYLPLSYGRLVVRKPLPASFFSYLRYQDAGTDAVIAADLSLVDDEGRELVAVRDFVLRRVDPDAVTGSLATQTARAAAPVAPAEAIAPADGAEAFQRSITAGLGAQVVIATRPVAEVRERTGRVSTESLDGQPGPGQPAPGEPGEPAPVPAGAPGSRAELEATIAEVVREALGVESLAMDSDLFALGANSLIAVQLIASMRRATGVRLPMRSLFETPTVAGLAALIDELHAGDPTTGPAHAGPEP